MPRSFLIDISSGGRPEFVDPKDRERYQRTLSKLRNAGQTKVVMTIEAFEETQTTTKQKNLWNVMLWFITEESGQDKQTVEQTLLANFQKDVGEMSNSEFTDCLDHAFYIAREMFGVELYMNKTGKIEQKP